MQAKLDLLASIAEEREDTETEPFRVLMIGDSTMSHQFGAICGFMGEREGRRFDPEVCFFFLFVSTDRAKPMKRRRSQGGRK